MKPLVKLFQQIIPTVSTSATHMKNWMFEYALKEISRRKKRYILNVMLVALVVVMLITLNSLSIAYSEASRLPFEKIHSSIIIQRNGNVPENTSGVVTSCSLAPIRHNVVEQIRNIEGVKDISYGLFLWVFDKEHFKRVLGVNWNDSLGAKIKAGIVDGSPPDTGGEVLIERTYAERYNITTGQKIAISGKNFTVSGIFKNPGNIVASDIVMSLKSAQNLAYNSVNLQKTEKFMPDDINIIFVQVEQRKIREVQSKLENILNRNNLNGGKTPTGKTIGKYTIYTPESFENQIESLFVLSDRLMLLISLITIAGACVIIVKNMSHAVMQRKREFGIMKSVGFTGKDIQKEIAVETAIQALAGYFLGVMLSLISIALLSRTEISLTIPWELNPYPHFLASNPSLAATVETYFLPIKFQPFYGLVSFLVTVFIGILTTLLITNQINKLKPAEVLRNE